MSDRQENTFNVTSCKKPVVDKGVNGIPTRVLIDSESISNLMGISEYEELKAQGLNTEMEKCHRWLYAYGGRELEVICQIQVEISVVEKKINSHFVVIKSGRCL